MEHRVLGKLFVNRLKLAPKQQDLVDNGVRLDQWSLGRSHLWNPFDYLCRKLIRSINNSRKASTILMENGYCVTDHCLTVDQAIIHASKEAFLPIKE